MSILAKEVDLATTTENLGREALRRFGPNVKVVYNPELPLHLIKAPDDTNHRFAVGQTIAGVTITSDQRNLGGMAQEIRALDGIQTPLVVVFRDNGEYWLKQGFRRYNASKLIIAETPQSVLAERLRRGVPCMVYSGLTTDQEKSLVNDQTSKPFSMAEVFNIFREEIEGGYHWLNVCERMYRQIGQVTGSLEKVRNIDTITDPKEREKALRAWLLSFAYQGWYCGIKSGPKVKNLWLQTYLWKDKFGGVQRPEVVMDTTRQKAIWTAIAEDSKVGEWKAREGSGPRVDALLEKFAKEDRLKYNEDGSKRKKEQATEKIRSLKELQELISGEEPENTPTLLSRVFRISLKDGGDPEACRLIRNFDRCRQVFEEHKPYMPIALRETFSIVFDGVEGSEDRLLTLISANAQIVSPDTEPLPEPEPAPLPEPEPAPLPEPTPEPVTEPTPEPVTEPASPVVDESPVVVSEDAPDVFDLVEHTTTTDDNKGVQHNKKGKNHKHARK